MLYVKSIKGFKVRREIFFITLPCAKKAYDKFITLPCEKKAHVPNICRVFYWMTHGKRVICRVSGKLPTANFGHTENTVFPAVTHELFIYV